MNDMSWVAPTVAAFGAIIASIISAILAYLASKNAQKTKEVVAATATAVDGRMTQLLEVTRKNAASEAKEEEQAAEHDRKVAIAYATEVVPPVLDSADQHLIVAEEKARKLLETAAIKAAQLLKDARKST